MALMMAQRAEMPAADADYSAQSKSGSLKVIIWVAAGLPTLFVLMRCYTRICLRRVFGVDDSFMVAAVILLIAYAAVLTVAADKGLGRHLEYVAQNPEDAMDVALLSFVSQPLVIMSCAFGKTSFALTLIRVAAQHWVMVLLWFIIISMNILHMLISIFVFARCEDPRHLWNPSIPSNCWSAKAFDDLSLFIGSYSAATDFILALLPWVILWKLQMKRREKFGVAVAMSLGIFAGSIAIIKIQYLVANTDGKDITYSLASLLGWAGVENGVILLGACVPTLRPLLKKIFPGSSAKKEEPSNDSTELITFTNFNMFAPKARRGHWRTTVETEIHQEADDQSERSILKRAPEECENIEVVHRLSRGACRTQSNDAPHHIKKTIEVDVIYDQP
uniref:Rhodopsin domain-containing protein n=2 Tax=Photinus pyralis TaxID=7054 RepID=A0A1Y1M768_PHOPY